MASDDTIEALDFFSPGVYPSRLQDIWERYNEGYRPMATVNVVFEYSDGDREQAEVEIPLSVKGSMWAWLVDKPVANKNPYRTLLEKLCEEGCVPFDYDKCKMFVSTHNSPENFDKRLIKPTKDFVFVDDSLADDQVIIEGTVGDNPVKKTNTKDPEEVSKRVSESVMERAELAQAQLDNEIEELESMGGDPVPVMKPRTNNKSNLEIYMEAIR